MTAPDFADLLLLAKLAEAAYLVDEHQLALAVGDLGLVYQQRIADAECQCFLAHDMVDTAYVVFQGTRVTKNADPAEWLVDLQVDPLDIVDQGRRVTSGAWRGLQTIAPRLVDALDNEASFANIRLTGHSLGGWYAHLAQEVLARAGGIAYKPAVSFGAPKCGNEAFWATLPQPIRVTARHDFAPDWAPRLPWTQPGQQLWLNGTGWAFTDHRPPLNISVADHSIDGSYIPLLEAALRAAASCSAASPS
jgi:hypothetical protein